MKHHITGWVLPHLTEHDLKYELGMTRIDTRKKFQLALEELRQVCHTVAAEEDAAKQGVAFEEPDEGPMEEKMRRDNELAQSVNLQAGVHTVEADDSWEGVHAQGATQLEEDDEWA